MRSLRGVLAVGVLIATIPISLAAGILVGGAEVAVHFGLAAGTGLFALAMFDFRVPRLVNVVASAAALTMASVFLLQGAAEMIPSLHHLAYEVLGQQLETLLGAACLTWCVVMLVSDSGGRSRLFGAAALSSLLAVALLGGMLPEIAKIAVLPVFVWLLVECLEPATAGSELRPVAARRVAAPASA